MVEDFAPVEAGPGARARRIAAVQPQPAGRAAVRRRGASRAADAEGPDHRGSSPGRCSSRRSSSGCSIFAISGSPRSLLVVAHVAADAARQLHLAEDPDRPAPAQGGGGLRAQVRGARRDALPRAPARAGGAQRRGRARRRGVRGGHAARADALDDDVPSTGTSSACGSAPPSPSRATTVKRSRSPDALPEFVDRVDRLRERYRPIDGVPVVESLQSVGVIGVAGGRPRRRPTRCAASACSCSACTRPTSWSPSRSPSPAGRRELEWLKWLPHTSSERSPFRDMPLADSASTGAALLSGLEELVMRGRRRRRPPRLPFDDGLGPDALRHRRAPRRGRGHLPRPDRGRRHRHVRDAPVDRARLTQVLERGADVGVYGLFVAPIVDALPAVCRSFLDVTSGLERGARRNASAAAWTTRRRRSRASRTSS